MIVLIEGEKYELHVHPESYCRWESLEKEVNNDIKNKFGKYDNFYFKAKMHEEMETPIQISQVRVYSDGKDGFIES